MKISKRLGMSISVVVGILAFLTITITTIFSVSTQNAITVNKNLSNTENYKSAVALLKNASSAIDKKIANSKKTSDLQVYFNAVEAAFGVTIDTVNDETFEMYIVDPNTGVKYSTTFTFKTDGGEVLNNVLFKEDDFQLSDIYDYENLMVQYVYEIMGEYDKKYPTGSTSNKLLPFSAVYDPFFTAEWTQEEIDAFEFINPTEFFVSYPEKNKFDYTLEYMWNNRFRVAANSFLENNKATTGTINNYGIISSNFFAKDANNNNIYSIQSVDEDFALYISINDADDILTTNSMYRGNIGKVIFDLVNLSSDHKSDSWFQEYLEEKNFCLGNSDYCATNSANWTNFYEIIGENNGSFESYDEEGWKEQISEYLKGLFRTEYLSINNITDTWNEKYEYSYLLSFKSNLNKKIHESSDSSSPIVLDFTKTSDQEKYSTFYEKFFKNLPQNKSIYDAKYEEIYNKFYQSKYSYYLDYATSSHNELAGQYSNNRKKTPWGSPVNPRWGHSHTVTILVSWEAPDNDRSYQPDSIDPDYYETLFAKLNSGFSQTEAIEAARINYATKKAQAETEQEKTAFEEEAKKYCETFAKDLADILTGVTGYLESKTINMDLGFRKDVSGKIYISLDKYDALTDTYHKQEYLLRDENGVYYLINKESYAELIDKNGVVVASTTLYRTQTDTEGNYYLVDSNGNTIIDLEGNIIPYFTGNTLLTTDGIRKEDNGNVYLKVSYKNNEGIMTKGYFLIRDNAGRIYLDVNGNIIDKDNNILLPLSGLSYNINKEILDKNGKVVVDRNGTVSILFSSDLEINYQVAGNYTIMEYSYLAAQYQYDIDKHYAEMNNIYRTIFDKQYWSTNDNGITWNEVFVPNENMANKTITIKTGTTVYIDGDLVIGNNAHIIVEDGAMLFINGSLTLNSITSTGQSENTIASFHNPETGEISKGTIVVNGDFIYNCRYSGSLGTVSFFGRTTTELYDTVTGNNHPLTGTFIVNGDARFVQSGGIGNSFLTSSSSDYGSVGVDVQATFYVDGLFEAKCAANELGVYYNNQQRPAFIFADRLSVGGGNNLSDMFAQKPQYVFFIIRSEIINNPGFSYLNGNMFATEASTTETINNTNGFNLSFSDLRVSIVDRISEDSITYDSSTASQWGLATILRDGLIVGIETSPIEMQ